MSDSCGNCAAPLPGGARFCPACGTPVASPAPQSVPPAATVAAPAAPAQSPLPSLATPARPRVAGERKPVTALFADVVGSVTLAETMDPEDWSVLMSRALNEIESGVRLYGGTIAKLLGDGVLALFGAETAHEDDPERAVRAALAILTSFEALGRQVGLVGGREFAIRIGMNTGLALVGTVAASDDHADMTAYGDTVNVAARIHAAAEPGRALITATTYRLVAHCVDVRDMGEATLKGRSEAVHTYELVGVKAAPSSPRGIEGLRSPMVGRSEQLAVLERAVADLPAGRGRAAIVVGEPGIGKSRLLSELRARVTEADRARWAEGHARSFGQALPDHLLIDLVRGIEALPPLPGVAGGDDVAIAHLLGRDLPPAVVAELEKAGPEALRGRYMAAVDGLLRAAAARPLVLVLDDLHWADTSSVNGLGRLLSTIAELPILLIAATREDADAVGWRLVDQATATLGSVDRISLTALSDQDTRSLVSNLLEIDALPEGVKDRILAHADGNPFFVEETVRMLMDRGAIVSRDGRWRAMDGIAGIEIPATIHGLLLGRIDRQPAAPKRAIRVGSVIGREFGQGLLATVLAATGEPADATLAADLAALEAAGLIRSRLEPAGPVHRFRHALIQEAAYDSLLRAERVELHRAVGTALEASGDDRLDELAPTIADHFEAAAEPARALAYARRAAEAAFRRYALPEAIAEFRRAIRLANDLGLGPGELTELYLRGGRAIELTDRYPEAIAHYDSMIQQARALADREMELAALTARVLAEAFTLSGGGVGSVVEAHALAALELARELGDRPHEARLLWILLLANRFGWGDWDVGIEYGRQALALARELGLEEQVALSGQDLARSLGARGQLPESLPLLDAAIDYWRRVSNLPLLSDGLRIRSMSRFVLGDLDGAQADLEASLAIDETTRNAWGRAFSRAQLAGVLFDRGRLAEARSLFDDARAIADTTGIALLRILTRLGLASLLLHLGELEPARVLVDEVLPVAHMNPVGLTYARSVSAGLEQASGRIERAVEDARVAAELLKQNLFAFGGLRWWDLPIEAFIAARELAEARAVLSPILRAVEEKRLRGWEPEARRLLGEILLLEGEIDGAEDQLRRALTVADEIGQVRSRPAIFRVLAEIASRRAGDSGSIRS